MSTENSFVFIRNGICKACHGSGNRLYPKDTSTAWKNRLLTCKSCSGKGTKTTVKIKIERKAES